MKKTSQLLKSVLATVLLAQPLLVTAGTVQAAETVNIQQSKNIAFQQALREQLSKMETMTETEKIEEFKKFLAQHEGETFSFIQEGTGFRSAAITTVKIVNGGINFWAFNPEGIDKLANTFGWAAFGEGATLGATALATGIATKLGIAATALTGGLAAIIAGLGTYLISHFTTANNILREYEKAGATTAGVRLTATETLDISHLGPEAYA